MKEQLIEVVLKIINLLDACSDYSAAWFRERLEVLRKEPVESERFQGVIREIKGIIAGGMGSFIDISLSPVPESGLSKRDARILQWDLANELDRAIAQVLIHT